MNMQQLGEQITGQKDAFLHATLGAKVDIAFNRRLGMGLFGGDQGEGSVPGGIGRLLDGK
ncbi:MAG: hypothetical protein ABW080_10505 [Candidatus Thiodiazotropha sp.]